MLKIVLIPTVASLLMAGCAISPNTPTKEEFTVFAQAGTKYAVAVDKLLDAAGTTQIDSTSWSLVNQKQSAGMDSKTYREYTRADIKKLELITMLKQQVWLLQQYFDSLGKLSSSDAPERTKTSINGLILELNNIKKNAHDATPLPELGKIAVDTKIRGALHDELNNRKDVIREHLALQENLIRKLKGEIEQSLNINKNIQEGILIEEIVSGELRNPEQWVLNRHKILYMHLTLDELDKASYAATKLRKAFEDLITGEITSGRLNTLITDIENLFAIAKKIKP